MQARGIRAVSRVGLSAAFVVACAVPQQAPPTQSPRVAPPQSAVTSWGGGAPPVAGTQTNAFTPNGVGPNGVGPSGVGPSGVSPHGVGAPSAGTPSGGGAPSAGTPSAGTPGAGTPGGGAPSGGAPGGGPGLGGPGAPAMGGQGAPAMGEPGPPGGGPGMGGPAAPNHGGAGAPGVPTNIALVIIDGSGQDFLHAKYQPGSVLHLGANIRDGFGNPTVGTENEPCTPAYRLSDATNPDGSARASLVGNVLTFLAPGPFTVSVHCAQNPRIESQGKNEAPYNFETSTSKLAKATPEAAAAPAPKAGVNAVRVVAVLLAAAGLVVIIYELKQLADLSADPGGGGGCPTEAQIGGCGTTACIPASCQCPGNFRQTGVDNGTRCGSPAGQRLCSCPAVTVAEQSRPVSTVRELVARGMASQAGPLGSGAACNTFAPVVASRASRASRASSTMVTFVADESRPRTPSAGRWRSADRDAVLVGGKLRRIPVSALVPISASVASTTIARVPSTTTVQPISRPMTPRRYDPRSSSPPAAYDSDLDIKAMVLKLSISAYAIVSAARGTSGTPKRAGVEVVPWSEPQAAGLTMTGRF